MKKKKTLSLNFSELKNVRENMTKGLVSENFSLYDWEKIAKQLRSNAHQRIIILVIRPGCKFMNKKGYFGQFGGQFVPELLYPALTELEKAFEAIKRDRNFKKELDYLLKNFAGRPTPLYFAANISQKLGFKVYFKREDLLHGGSHKLNNVLGQVLLAKKMGKTRIITETAAGMHGVATVMAANILGIRTEVYMGEKDVARQSLNARKIEVLGGIIHPVSRGYGVLKDAVSEAMVDWVKTEKTTHYLIGSTVGAHPFPTIVAYFQRIIGEEMRKQILSMEGKLPVAVMACGSGGSNALGAFQAFLKDKVDLIFTEGVGAFSAGSIGVFQGAKTYLMQDEFGMDRKTESRSAGLNYPARGPQLAYLVGVGRVKVKIAIDKEAIEAFKKVASLEGIIPALETSHVLAELFKRKGEYKKNDAVIVNFSGRGDKDMETVLKYEK